MTSPSVAPSDQPSAGITLPATSAGIARTAQLLNSGKLAVVPTETVYGIAVNLHAPDARRSARGIKQLAAADDPARPDAAPHSPWVVHLAQPRDVLSWVPHLSPTAKRLVTKSLPGPVAYQIKLTPEDEAAARERLGAAADETIIDGSLTLRVPDMQPTQQVLEAVRAPVAIIGAGTRAQPGIFEVAEIPPTLLQYADGPRAILDAGPTRYRKSSTLVRIDGEHYSILRPGVIDERILHKLADLTIVFLCSGNTCRSPMAAALAAKQLADKLGIAPSELPLRHIVVQSAGLHASRGMRAALEAVDAVKPYGADLATHYSQPATPDLLRRADAIYTMTSAHRDEVLDLLPGVENKTFRLDPDRDVADPIGAGISVYQQVASRLNSLLQQRLGELSL